MNTTAVKAIAKKPSTFGKLRSLPPAVLSFADYFGVESVLAGARRDDLKTMDDVIEELIARRLQDDLELAGPRAALADRS